MFFPEIFVSSDSKFPFKRICGVPNNRRSKIKVQLLLLTALPGGGGFIHKETCPSDYVSTLLEHMQKKFEIKQTKIKSGCQSGRKVVTH